MLERVVREAARRHGEVTAYTDADDPGRSVTYAELDRYSDEVAAGLARRGVGPGDVVALALPPVLEYPLAYAAIAKLGAITAGVNTRLTGDERRVLLDVVDPALVIADAEDPVGADVPELGISTRSTDPLQELREPGDPPPPLEPDPDRQVLICFTSGTTGRPKGVLFGERQLAFITQVDVGDRWGGGGVSLAGTSYAHLGPMTKLPGNLMKGGTTHVLRRWRASRALELTAELGITYIGGIPTQVALMLAQPDFDEYDLSAVQMVVMGGGPATPALIREARERFQAAVMTRYSCTEAGIGLGTGPTDPPEDAEETIGRPHPSVDLAIRDDPDGEDLPSGEIGEILLRSPAVMTGYYRNPEATAEAITHDGFVRTGDLGWVDDRGRVRLAGRRSERYVRGGYNVHPSEVEAVLHDHPAVRDVAVVAVPDDVWGEIGVAVVVPQHTDALELEELRGFAATRLAKHKLPERLVLLDELPLTAAHKLDKRGLTQTIRERLRGEDRP